MYLKLENDKFLKVQKMMIEKVREIVKKECDERELAELGALLHDIGRIKFGGKNHEITGIPEAEKS